MAICTRFSGDPPNHQPPHHLAKHGIVFAENRSTLFTSFLEQAAKNFPQDSTCLISKCNVISLCTCILALKQSQIAGSCISFREASACSHPSWRSSRIALGGASLKAFKNKSTNREHVSGMGEMDVERLLRRCMPFGKGIHSVTWLCTCL